METITLKEAIMVLLIGSSIMILKEILVAKFKMIDVNVYFFWFLFISGFFFLLIFPTTLERIIPNISNIVPDTFLRRTLFVIIEVVLLITFIILFFINYSREI
ncbi:MAG: hypothetical protein Q8P57_01140 [Candidatus Pacearchaeota archaeon]|nr:hypothetical protein [Candidatus Pacearchaeota archaeon]